MLRALTIASLFATTLVLPACLSDETEDAADDSFTDADGKADGYGLSDSEVAGVLAFVNQATAATLHDDVGLSTRVTDNITKHRAGADKKLGTADDDAFDDLPELDAVPYVGKSVFKALVDYAKAHGFVHDSGGAGFCATEHAGKTPSGVAVKVCDALYTSAPFVHLPADQVSGSTVTTYGVILNGLGLQLYTADGRQLPLVNGSGQTYGISSGPTGFKAPQNLFAIYAVVGTKATSSGQDAIKVSSLAPVAWIPGKLQDTFLLGTWEAKASTRISTGKFDSTKPVAFRFTLSTTRTSSVWSNYSGTDGLIDVGAIDNFDKKVTAADGTCLASLSSLGTSSPFYAPTANSLTLWRHPNMHGLNDQVIVMDYPTGSADLSMNGMGEINPFTIQGLIDSRSPDYSDVEIRPHATPNGHLVWDFHKVTTGGTACN